MEATKSTKSKRGRDIPSDLNWLDQQGLNVLSASKDGTADDVLPNFVREMTIDGTSPPLQVHHLNPRTSPTKRCKTNHRPRNISQPRLNNIPHLPSQRNTHHPRKHHHRHRRSLDPNSPPPPPHRRFRGRSTVPVAQMKIEVMEQMSARSQTMLGGSMHQSQRKGEMSTGGRTMLKGPIYWSSRGFLFMSSGRNGHTTSARLWQKQWIRTDTHLPDLLID